MTPAPHSPSKSKTAWNDSDVPSNKEETLSPKQSSAEQRTESKRSSIMGGMFGRKSVSQRKGDHRWDGLNEDLIDLPAPPGKVITLVIPSLLSCVAVGCLIFFFASYPKTDQASKEGTCQISGFVPGTDCVDCRLTIDIDQGKMRGDIQVMFKKEGGQFVPENKAFACCPRDEDAGCCEWKDNFGKFCDIVAVEGQLPGCTLGPWSCIYSDGPGNAAHNIQHGTKAEVFLLLILGCVLLVCVLILVKWNHHTYQKRVAIVHMNMNAQGKLLSEQEERKASKERRRMTEQVIIVKQAKFEDVQDGSPSPTQTGNKTPGKTPKSPWTAPAKIQKSKSFESPKNKDLDSPKKSGEKSPKKRQSGTKDSGVEIKRSQTADLGSPSQSNLAQRRGMKGLGKAQDDGFQRADTLDDVPSPSKKQAGIEV